MIDQWGNSVDSSLLFNKIYIADFFFTTCPAICIDMGQNFQHIQEVYKEEERFRAQGFNDFIVFSVQATASLTAGIVLSFTSWKIMNILCIPFLIIIIFTTLRADRLLDKTN